MEETVSSNDRNQALYAIVDGICVILAAVAAGDGRSYRYPLSIRFVR